MNWKKLCELALCLLLLVTVWVNRSFEKIYLDTDIARDLSETSNILSGRTVWLGPRLAAIINTSPIYYYLQIPGLLLSNRDGNSLFWTSLLLGLLVLGFVGWNMKSLLLPLTLGTSSVWMLAVTHPGNGFGYGIWLVGALTILWTEGSIIPASLLIGLALAYHPFALIGLLILIYELWRRKTSWRYWGASVIMILLPFLPLIIFEVITRGFLIRELVNNWGKITYGVQAPQILLTLWQLVGLWLVVGLGNLMATRSKRLRYWMIMSGTVILFLMLRTKIQPHYLIGVSLVWIWGTIVGLREYKYGKLILLMLVTWQIVSVVYLPLPKAKRTMNSVAKVVEQLVDQKILNESENIAVVAILDKENKVPVADDYRFFLRMKGFKVLNVQEYAQANTLVEFVETPSVDWKKWSSWEIDLLGPTYLDREISIENTKIVVRRK